MCVVLACSSHFVLLCFVFCVVRFVLLVLFCFARFGSVWFDLFGCSVGWLAVCFYTRLLLFCFCVCFVLFVLYCSFCFVLFLFLLFFLWVLVGFSRFFLFCVFLRGCW